MSGRRVTTAADGTALRWRRYGRRSGTPVLLLQGFGTPGAAWAVALAHLVRHADCVVPDLRSVGGSGGGGARYTGRLLAEDALAVLDGAGLDDAHVVGNSLGGSVAQTLAVHAPSRVRSLSLLASTCGHTEWRDGLFHRLQEHGEAGRKRDVVATMAPWVRRRGGSPVVDAAVARVARLAPAVLRSPAEGLGAQAHVVLSQPPGLCRDLAATGLPSLVVAGAWDRLAPREETRALAELLGARYVELAAGHLLSGTPAAARAVRDFVRDVEAARTG